MRIDTLLDEHLGVLVLVIGQSGDGKTACIRGLPAKTGKVILSEPNGARTLKRLHPKWKDLDVIIPKGVKDFHETVTSFVGSGLKWIVLDTVTRYYDLVWQQYLQVKNKEPDYSEYQIYRYCLHYFDNLLHRLCDVADSGTDVFLTCHVKMNQEGDDRSRSVWFTPDLPGVLPERFARRLDVVCRTRKPRNSLQGAWELTLPMGRNAGKDLLGVFDNGPVSNDFSHFLHKAHKAKKTNENKGDGSNTRVQFKPKGQTGVARARSSDSPSSSFSPDAATASKKAEPAPSPPSKPESNKIRLSVRRSVPKAQRALLKTFLTAANLNDQYVTDFIKDQFKKEDLDDLTIEEFAKLSAHVTDCVKKTSPF